MTKYELYLCDISGEHQPIAKFESNTPFHTVVVGERFDDHGWDRLDGSGKIASVEKPIRYIVHSIKHSIAQEKEALIVQYWLNLRPYNGMSSPVWG